MISIFIFYFKSTFKTQLLFTFLTSLWLWVPYRDESTSWCRLKPWCVDELSMCKERDFIPTWISAPLPASNQASIPTFQSRKLYKSISVFPLPVFKIFPLPVSPNPSKSMQITSTHLLLLYYTVIDWHWPTHVERPIFHCVIWYLAYTHHRKDLFLASQFEYKVDMFWIRGSEVIVCQGPKILTPDLAETRDPRYELTPDTLSRQSTWDPHGSPGPPGPTWAPPRVVLTI